MVVRTTARAWVYGRYKNGMYVCSYTRHTALVVVNCQLLQHLRHSWSGAELPTTLPAPPCWTGAYSQASLWSRVLTNLAYGLWVCQKSVLRLQLENGPELHNRQKAACTRIEIRNGREEELELEPCPLSTHITSAWAGFWFDFGWARMRNLYL